MGYLTAWGLCLCGAAAAAIPNTSEGQHILISSLQGCAFIIRLVEGRHD